MDRAQEISSKLWNIYSKFCKKRKNDLSWDAFIEQGRAIANQYQGADKALAEDMFLAFVSYLEAQKGG